MEEKDDETINEDDLDEAMKFLISLPAPNERERFVPSQKDLDRKFRLTQDDGDVKFQEVEDE